MTSLDDALNRVNLGQLSASALKVLDAAFEAESAAIDSRIYRVFAAGETLEPQQAVQAWAQKHALFALRRRLQQNVRAGETSSARIAPLMNGGPDG